VKRLIPIITILAVLAAACDDAGADDAARERAPWWLLIIVAGGLIIVLVALVLRGAKRDRAPDLTIWKNNARTGYAQSRWLYDAMDEDMAVWRGTTMAADTAPEAAGIGRSRTWADLPKRYDAAKDALYRLEASAPDHRTANAARDIGRALRATRAAFDDRADARLAYLRLETESRDPSAMVSAREREVRTSMRLSEARIEFADAIEHLAKFA